MAGNCAPSLLQLTAQVNGIAPHRDKASDGCCASASHSKANPTSDHEPARIGVAKGFCRAKDIDEDLLIPNYSMGQMIGDLQTDPRSKYLIYERRIWFAATSSSHTKGWHPYNGINPHDKHCHVSIWDWAVRDVRPWPIGPLQPQFEEDEMAIAEQLNQIIAEQKWQHEKLMRMGHDNFRFKRALGLEDAEVQGEGSPILTKLDTLGTK